MRVTSLRPKTRIPEGDAYKPASQTPEADMDVKPECEELKQKLRQALDENVKLQAIIADITQVNKRWQRYNSDRQMYVQKLLNTIQDQQVQINNIGEEKAFSSKQPESPSEVCCNRNECKTARDEVKRLTENVQLLEFQVKAHKDDWEAERNEKQEIIKEKDSTKAHLTDVVRELHTLRGLLSKCSCYCKTYNISCDPEETNRHSVRSRRPSDSNSAILSRMPYQRRAPCDLFNDGDLTCDSALDDNRTFAKLQDFDEFLPDGEENACALATSQLPGGSSYSRSSTLSAVCSRAIPDPSWMEEEGNHIPIISVSSSAFVRLPVVKSSSAPERRSLHGKQPKCAASISLTVLPDSPSDTLTREDIICPNCNLKFQPESHLEFLDHFDGCQKA